MSNPMKYIKELEAVGFKRNQAEAQVQVMLDAIEGELVTKTDLLEFQQKIDNRFAQVDNKFLQIELRIKESEFRLLTKLGGLMVGGGTIAVAALAWLIKIN